MTRPLAGVLVALVGCGSDGVAAQLADLENVAVEVTIESPDVGVNLVSLRFDGVEARFPDECPILGGDFAGRFRGRVMTVRTPGGAGETACELPALELDAAAGPSNNVVEVRDDSLTITALFPATALETRVATHESWRFARGVPAAIDWSHAADLAGAMPVIVLGDRELAATASASQIAFTIPDDVAPGAHPLIAKSLDPSPDLAQRCDGAAACRATQAGVYHHDATIE